MSAVLVAATLSAGLVGTRYSLALSIGTERGSWMPPAWGASGARAQCTPIVEFLPDGQLKLCGSGAWDHLTVAWRESGEPPIVGGWSVDGEKSVVTIFLEHDGIARQDVCLEAGRLYFTAGAWGDLLQRRGNLTIRQRRFGWCAALA